VLLRCIYKEFIDKDMPNKFYAANKELFLNPSNKV
jgi:hypothetical protein